MKPALLDDKFDTDDWAKSTKKKILLELKRRLEVLS
jgi:hypothetical protein